MAPMWIKLMKLVHLGEPTSLVNANRMKLLLKSIQRCSNHEILLEHLKNCAGWEKRHAKTVAWSCDMEGHAKKWWKDILSWRRKTESSCTKSHLLAWTTFTSSKEELETVGELSKVCSQIVTKWWYLAPVCRPDILWSVNKTCKSSHKMDECM